MMKNQKTNFVAEPSLILFVLVVSAVSLTMLVQSVVPA